MSDAGEVIVEKPEADDVDGDIREAIQSLKDSGAVEKTEPEAKIVLDKPRDDEGKFVKAEEKPKRETLTIPEKAAPQPAPVLPEPVPAPVAAAPAVKPPEGLRAEFKARWGEIPADFQAEITRREDDLQKQLFQHDTNRDMGRKINEMANPYLPTIRAEGATVEGAFQDYLQTAHVLRSGTDAQKATAIAAVMQQFKVQPQALLSILQGGTVQSSVPSQQLSPEQIREQVKAEIEQQRIQSEVAAFATKPGHEHFEKVRPVMAALLDSGAASDFEDAYDKAVHADPEIRGSLIAASAAAEQEKRTLEQAAKTERAKSAAVSITGSPGAAKPNGHAGSVGSIEDDLRAAARQVQGRV